MFLIKYAISNIQVFAIWTSKIFSLYYLLYYWKNELSHFNKIQHKNRVLSITGGQIIWQFEKKKVNLTVIQ